jgi:AcrR family transcriptional regulator
MLRKGLETKQKLILAAVHLFAEKGIHWVSFQEIASKAGVAQPTLYKYFQDKDDLILACVEQITRSGRSLIDQNIDPLKSADLQMRAYIEGNLLWVEKLPQEAILLFAIYYLAYNHQAIRDLLLKINQQSVERLSVYISAGSREGVWQEGDFRKTARLIHSLLIAEMFKTMHEPKDMNLQQQVDLVWSAAKKILGVTK